MIGDIRKLFEKTSTKLELEDGFSVNIEIESNGITVIGYEGDSELNHETIPAVAEPALKLADKHGGTWGGHADYPVEDWQYEVANGDTRLGYWDWVLNKIEN